MPSERRVSQIEINPYCVQPRKWRLFTRSTALLVSVPHLTKFLASMYYLADSSGWYTLSDMDTIDLF